MTISNNPQTSFFEPPLERRFPVVIRPSGSNRQAPQVDHRESLPLGASLVGADLLTPAQVAEMLSISVRTLAAWRSVRRSSLPWVRVGNQIRYRKLDVAAWLESQVQTNDVQRAGFA